jgi:hypothetical protein
MHADATLRAALLDGDERIEAALNPQRIAYVHWCAAACA